MLNSRSEASLCGSGGVDMNSQSSARPASWPILTGLAQAYLSLGAKVCRTSLQITSGYQMRAADRLLAAVRDSGDPQELLKASLLEVRSYVVELATLVPFALDGTINGGDIGSRN